MRRKRERRRWMRERRGGIEKKEGDREVGLR